MQNDDTKHLVHQVTRELVGENAPEHLAEFERDFDHHFAEAEQSWNELDIDQGYAAWALPFDPSFTSGVLLGMLVGIATMLIQEARTHPEPFRSRKLAERRRQLDRRTGHEPIVQILFDRIEEILRRIERRISGWSEPADVELQVHVRSDPEGAVLHYDVHSPAADFHHQTIHGPRLGGHLEDFLTSLLAQIENLHQGRDVDGNRLRAEERRRELASIGRYLYSQLFPTEMRRAYWRITQVPSIRSIQITSDEPGIPWELLKPFDGEGEAYVEHDFLCLQFQLTRWCSGRAPAPAFQVRRLAVLGSNALPRAADERSMLAGLAHRHTFENRSPERARLGDVLGALSRHDCDLLHFVGHGDFDSRQADESKISLEDQPLRARHLAGAVQAKIRKTRPLVFLNACRVGRQGWSPAGLGGWVQAWIRACWCGALLAPQWLVDDTEAYELATAFYAHLEQGHTLGEALRRTRRLLRDQDGSRLTWLAMAIYGHPNARVHFGEGPPDG